MIKISGKEYHEILTKNFINCIENYNEKEVSFIPIVKLWREIFTTVSTFYEKYLGVYDEESSDDTYYIGLRDSKIFTDHVLKRNNNIPITIDKLKRVNVSVNIDFKEDGVVEVSLKSIEDLYQPWYIDVVIQTKELGNDIRYIPYIKSFEGGIKFIDVEEFSLL